LSVLETYFWASQLLAAFVLVEVVVAVPCARTLTEAEARTESTETKRILTSIVVGDKPRGLMVRNGAQGGGLERIKVALPVHQEQNL